MESNKKILGVFIIFVVGTIIGHLILSLVGMLPPFQFTEGEMLGITIIAGLCAYGMSELPTDH